MDPQCLKNSDTELYSLRTRKNLTFAHAMDNQHWTKHIDKEFTTRALHAVQFWEQFQHLNLHNHIRIQPPRGGLNRVKI
jgi:hypothetical protein